MISVMLVAGLLAHRENGFFVFRDGYEYVLVLAVACLALSPPRHGSRRWPDGCPTAQGPGCSTGRGGCPVDASTARSWGLIDRVAL